MIPNDDRQPYHLELTDGVATVGLILCDRDGNANPRAFQRTPIPRSSLKISTGEQKNSDLEPPWTDVVQEDWGGGHGGEAFDDDASRYWDGYRMDSTRGYLTHGPMETFATGIRTWDGHWKTRYMGGGSLTDPIAATYRYYNLFNAQLYWRYWAFKFTASATFTVAHAWLYLNKTGAPGNLTVAVYSDNAGAPNVSLASATITASSVEAGILTMQRVALSVDLTASTDYWFVVKDAGGTSTAYWSVLGDYDGSFSTFAHSADGTTNWSTADASVGCALFRLTNAEDPFRAHFGILKNNMYVGLEYFDGGDSAVYINGTGGVATAGAATYLRDANNATIVDDAYNGALIYLWDGPGSSVHRMITDTKSANSEIDVSDWGITPTAATKYAVLDTEKFTLAGTFATATSKIITDVIAANGALYWAAGDGATAYVRRLRHFWTAGAPGTYYEWQDEAVSGTLLESLTDGGAIKLWLANRSLPGTLKHIAALDCTAETGSVAAPAAGAWTTATAPGDLEVKTTGLITYGESFPRMHVLKENAIIEYVGNQPQELRIAALRNARDGWNGIACAVNDVYLYFSFLDRVQRYYSGQLDDIGPDLPANRRGKIMALVAAPGKLYAAIDGGPYNYSTIQVYNGRGWCELWRAPSVGLRIMNAFIQPIPGPYNADRLWFSCGSDIVSLPVAISPYDFNDPTYAAGTLVYSPYAFCPAGYIETGWMYLGLRQIKKLFNSISVVTQAPDGTDTQAAVIWYKLDNDTAWTLVSTTLGGTVSSAVLDDTTHNVTGKRIKLRIGVDGNFTYTIASSRASKIIATVLEALVTIPHKYQTTITFRLEDNAETLQVNGLDTYADADTKFSQLDTWAAMAGTVGMTSHIDMMNNKRVKIDAASVQMLKHEVSEINGRKRNRYLCQMSMIEVD